MTDYLSIQQAADVAGVTYMCIAKACRLGFLQHVYIGRHKHTTLEWIIEYQDKAKHRGNDVIRNGKKLFDEKKNRYSIRQASEILKFNFRNLFTEIYRGRFHAKKVGGRYVVTIEEINRFGAERFNYKIA